MGDQGEGAEQPQVPAGSGVGTGRALGGGTRRWVLMHRAVPSQGCLAIGVLLDCQEDRGSSCCPWPRRRHSVTWQWGKKSPRVELDSRLRLLQEYEVSLKENTPKGAARGCSGVTSLLGGEGVVTGSGVVGHLLGRGRTRNGAGAALGAG